MHIVLIIPTFNERGNIGRLIDELQLVFRSLPHAMQILVVDDNSPDHTGDEVRDRQRRSPNVHLLQGEKRGLGAAYIRGMHHALEALHADAVLEMDADFSHKPADVPRLIAALEQGADFAIGSRYVPGGRLPAAWAWQRRLSSRFGNLVARHVVGLYRVRDCTAGFRAIRSDVIRRLEFTTLHAQGYTFQIALLQAAVAGGAKVVELPVEFVDRAVGESKLGLRDIMEFLRNVAWIRWRETRQRRGR
jgi:dolichol-phosphate mannosyltransferase